MNIYFLAGGFSLMVIAVIIKFFIPESSFDYLIAGIGLTGFLFVILSVVFGVRVCDEYGGNLPNEV